MSILPFTASEDEKRRRYKQYWRDADRARTVLEASGVPPWEIARYYPPFPDELRDLACGAKTRAGTPCKITAIYSNGRCKLHGGLSTGPTSADGRMRAAQNGLNPKLKKRTP